MAVFAGALYAGTIQDGPADVWKWDGARWTLVEPEGFDSLPIESMNKGATSMAVWRHPSTHAEYLYVGTMNQSGCEIWRYDGSSWSRSVGPGGSIGRGFGDASNRNVACMASFGDYLYAGTNRDPGGLQVWRTNGSSWERVDGNVFGAANISAVTMCEFNGRLYLGTENHSTGCQVWKTDNGTTWTPCAVGGFGDTANQVAFSMAVFSNRLFVGTKNETSGLWVVSTSDGLIWSRMDGGALGPNNIIAMSMHVYKSHLYLGTSNETEGAQVWRSTDGTTWNRVDGGALGEMNRIASRMDTYGGFLHVGTWGACDVFYTDGSTWERSNNHFFSQNSNFSANAMVSHNGFLYLGTTAQTGGEVWKFDGSSWERISPQGFGDIYNRSVSSLTFFEGRLYAGVSNERSGCRVYSYDGSSWRQVNLDGFGDVNNRDVRSLKIYNGMLYAGTSNGATGGEVWAYDGSSWRQVNLDGFGVAHNSVVESLEVYDTHLFAAVSNYTNGCQIWQTSAQGGPPYTDWTQVNTDGFGNPNNKEGKSMIVFRDHLFVGTMNNTTGCELWAYDGSSWSKAAEGGFGNPANVAAQSMAVQWDRLYVGTDSSYTHGGNGCQVWSTAGTSGFPFNDWRQENEDGFGHSSYQTATCMENYFDQVLVGTFNLLYGCSIWSTGSVWYLAEGATEGGFETWVLVQNPGPTPVHVSFTLNTDQGEKKPADLQNVEIKAGSRRSFNLGDFVKTYEVSTKVTCSDGLVICERAMYWRPGPDSPRVLGHDSIGISP